MSSRVSDYLVTDDLTILLSLIGATVFLLNNFYKPQPLVHPILLGRQSDVGRVRNPGESAVYRNYGTGSTGRFPARPNKEVMTVADLVKPDFEGPRTLWSTRLTNHALQDRVVAFGTGLIRLAGLRPKDSRVFLLLNDSLEFVISDLALAAHSIRSYTLTSSKILANVFETCPTTAIITQAEFLSQILQVIYDADRTTNHTIIVVGEPTKHALATIASNIKVINFTDVEREGIKSEKIISPVPSPNDVFTVSFFESGSGQVNGVQLTHENLTAGVAAVRAVLPLTYALTPLDTIVSAHSMSTAYGRSIAYAAIYEGTSLATLNSSEVYRTDQLIEVSLADATSYKAFPIPSPTILFLKPGHLESTVSSINKQASQSWLLYPFARRHKVASLNEGFLTKDSLWDRLVLDDARAKVIGDGAGTIRGVIISGGPVSASLLTPSRIALSVPIINSYTHPCSAGPVMASHPLDLQDFSSFAKDAVAHVGPPSMNVEVKLVGLDDAAVEAGADPSGMLLIRGPAVGKVLSSADGNGETAAASEDDGGSWAPTGVRAKVWTNGAFQILS